MVKTELQVQSRALYKVPEGKEGNLVYGSARLGYGNQWQNLFVQKEKSFPYYQHQPTWKDMLMEPPRKMQHQQGFSLLTEIPHPAVCEKAQLNFFMEEAYTCLVGN